MVQELSPSPIVPSQAPVCGPQHQDPAWPAGSHSKCNHPCHCAGALCVLGGAWGSSHLGSLCALARGSNLLPKLAWVASKEPACTAAWLWHQSHTCHGPAADTPMAVAHAASEAAGLCPPHYLCHIQWWRALGFSHSNDVGSLDAKFACEHNSWNRRPVLAMP